MKKNLYIILWLSPIMVFAQSVEQQINEQVWKPFIKSFNAHDTEGFLAVHSKDVVRAPRDGKVVLNWTEYYKQQEQGDKHGKSSGSNRTLELRFTERIHGNNNGLAVEVGIYKTSYRGADGHAGDFYGRFHVVLRQEDGVWKILVDTDSSEGRSISEKDFLAAAPME